MKADVKTLIGNLTSERNRIDAAISALKAMSGDTESVSPTTAATRSVKLRRRRMTTAEKVNVMARLSSGERVVDIAKECGIGVMTVYKLRSRTNGAASVAVESQPATNATAIGIQ